jgi:hypothetical protein
MRYPWGLQTERKMARWGRGRGEQRSTKWVYRKEEAKGRAASFKACGKEQNTTSCLLLPPSPSCHIRAFIYSTSPVQSGAHPLLPLIHQFGGGSQEG